MTGILIIQTKWEAKRVHYYLVAVVVRESVQFSRPEWLMNKVNPMTDDDSRTT
jgi:hypothetical protein